MAAANTGIDTSLLPVGQLITIVPDSPANRGTGQPEAFPSRIEDVLEDAVVVSMPMKRRSFVALPINSTVSAYFHRGGARYYFRAVVGARADSPFPVLYLTDVGDMGKDERRSHVRVDACMEPVDMVVVDNEVVGGPDKRSTLVVNISAAGLGLVCRRPLPVGSAIRIAVDLPRGFGRVEADAEVVRCFEMDLGGVKKWRIGVAFRSMAGDQRDRVTSFVLYQQQLLRRRGLL